MNKNTQKSPTKRPETARTGAATIEFVLALPVLLMLIVSLTWLGFSMLAQAEVNIIARHSAWQQRHENPNANAFVFSTHPGYGLEDDFAKGESEKEVNVSRLFDAIPSPDAIELVLSGSWDHRAMPLDEFPNWPLYGKAVVNAKTGDLQNLLGGMDNFRNIMTDIGSDLLKNQLRQLSGLSNAKSPVTAIDQTKSDQQLSSESDKRQFLQRKIVLDKEIATLEEIKADQGGFLNATQKRKLFRLTSERSDLVIHLRELS